MAKMTKAQVLKYLKANGTSKKQTGSFTDFYLAGCYGRTNFWLKDVPNIRFVQVQFAGGYDWEAHSDGSFEREGVHHISTEGVFKVIEAHQKGENINLAYSQMAARVSAGYVDDVRPGARCDY
jgi:hypothetical protein